MLLIDKFSNEMKDNTVDESDSVDRKGNKHKM